MSIELNWNIQDWSALISFDVHAAGPVIGDNWLSSFVSKISQILLLSRSTFLDFQCKIIIIYLKEIK